MPSTWVAFGRFKEEKPFRAAKPQAQMYRCDMQLNRTPECIRPLAVRIRASETSWQAI